MAAPQTTNAFVRADFDRRGSIVKYAEVTNG
jgi:hypothetical protein